MREKRISDQKYKKNLDWTKLNEVYYNFSGYWFGYIVLIVSISIFANTDW